MKPDKIDAFFARLQAQNPHPKSDLEYTNTYTLLVAVVLSAQATDIGVNRATRDLFKRVSTPAQMLALGEEGVREHIKTIGLFNAKAKNVIELSRILVEKYNGEVPGRMEDLIALPGVGRKTANVVLNIAFGQNTIAVDTHLFRLANRLRMAPGRTPDDVERKLLRVVPEQYLRHAHHWLILHGRYVCKARTPDCANCIVYDLCDAKDKLKLDNAGNAVKPPRKGKPKATPRQKVSARSSATAKKTAKKPSAKATKKKIRKTARL